MKKTNKLIVVLSIIFCILAIGVMSYATTAGEVLEGLTGEGANVNTEGIKGLGNSIIAVVRIVGIVIAVVILLVLGIKYMMGSAAEKAEYKKTMIPYLVGAVLIFGASAIVQAVVKMTTMTTGTGA